MEVSTCNFQKKALNLMNKLNSFNLSGLILKIYNLNANIC